MVLKSEGCLLVLGARRTEGPRLSRGCPCAGALQRAESAPGLRRPQASACPWPWPTRSPRARAARPHRRCANLRPPRRESQREDQLVQAGMWRWVLRGPKPLPALLAEATGRASDVSSSPSLAPGTGGLPGHLAQTQPAAGIPGQRSHRPCAPQSFRALLGCRANWIWVHLALLIQGRTLKSKGGTLRK